MENENLQYHYYDGKWREGVYKYTYENWLAGEILPEDLDTLYDNREIGAGSYHIIKLKQTLAYLKMLNSEFSERIDMFKDKYEFILVKHLLLSNEIEKANLDILKFKEAFPEVYYDALEGNDQRFEITSEGVEKVLNTNKIYYMEANTAFELILKSQYLQWLLWFQAPNLEKGNEPSFEAEIKVVSEELQRFSEDPDAEPNLKLPHTKPRKEKTYVWQCNPEKELPDLYQLMKGKFISHSTTLEQFTAIFTGQPVEHIAPIKWHEDNASELLYFIMQLEETESIEKSSNRADFKKLTACFVKPDGSLYTARFKALKQNISNDLASNKQKAIQELLKTFQ